MKIFIDSGHSLYEPGAWYDTKKENEMTIALRKALTPLLHNYEVGEVPDNLNLKESIKWINNYAGVNDIALSIHFNAYNIDRNVGGTEAYYSNDNEKHMAEIFARTVSTALGIRNRGAKHDSTTWVGSLGFLRNLKCDSVLIEVCYLTGRSDMEVYSAETAACGIRDGIEEIIPRKVPEIAEKCGREADLQICKKQLSASQKVVAFLIRYLKSLQT